MELAELLIKIAKILGRLEIPYIVTGGVAASIWGRVRYTADIDIVIEITPQKYKILYQLLDDLRALDKDIHLDIDKETAIESLKQQGGFNFIHSASGLKVDFFIRKDDQFSELELDRAVIKKMEGQKVAFVSPEDLILSKLKWHKESESTRHLEDIESILKISKVDIKYIKNWAKRQSTIKILENLLNKI